MGWGKILGMAALGVGAVAAAPFTGGGSILGAATLGASLAGAGAIATGAGVAGAVAGAVMSEKEEEEQRRERKEERQKKEEEKKREEEKKKKLQQKLEKEKSKKELEKLNKELKETHKREEAAKEALKKERELVKINLIEATTALVVSMAHIDGDYAEEEEEEIDKYIDTLNESGKYTPAELDSLTQIIDNPPALDDALVYLDNVNPSDYNTIRNLLKKVMDADNKPADEEKDFMTRFDKYTKQ